MANFIAVTASSGARIKDGKRKELEAYLEKYSTDSEDGELAKIEDGEEPTLEIYGYGWFTVWEKFTNEDGEEEIDFDTEKTNEFSLGLAPFLAEPLVIQLVGNEKCRFPLAAWECKVHPDGRVEENGFKFC